MQNILNVHFELCISSISNKDLMNVCSWKNRHIYITFLIILHQLGNATFYILSPSSQNTFSQNTYYSEYSQVVYRLKKTTFFKGENDMHCMTKIESCFGLLPAEFQMDPKFVPQLEWVKMMPDR